MHERILQLLEQYKELAKTHAEIDYSDMGSVKRGNKAVEKMNNIAEIFFQMGNDGIETFAILLDEPKNRVQNWVAIRLLEFMNISKEIEKKALIIVEASCKNTGVDAYGTIVWFEDWKKRKS